MKKLISLIIILSLTTGIKAQNAVKDSKGNYTAILKAKTTQEAKNTGSKFTDNKGTVYPVMESKNGKLFYVRTSKAGNEYKVYLKL